MKTQQCMPVELHATNRYDIKIGSFAPKMFNGVFMAPARVQRTRSSRNVPDIYGAWKSTTY